MIPAADCRNGRERRTRVQRWAGLERRVASRRRDEDQSDETALEGDSHETESGAVPLSRLIPHAQFSEREAADRSAAIAAHHRDLSARLGRRVSVLVAALDYLQNVSSDLVAPTIVERHVLEVLEHRSVTDPLTGLFNRGHFEATLKREVARCLRYQSRLSLVLMDLDRFKTVNDRWGHQAGDRVLGQVAVAIQNTLRVSDIAARYGGDEFAVILPDTDARAGRCVGERICAAVRASLGEGTVADDAIKVTVSGGLAELPLAAAGASEAHLITAADRALYLAKSRGGNRVAGEVQSWPG